MKNQHFGKYDSSSNVISLDAILKLIRAFLFYRKTNDPRVLLEECEFASNVNNENFDVVMLDMPDLPKLTETSSSKDITDKRLDLKSDYNFHKRIDSNVDSLPQIIEDSDEKFDNEMPKLIEYNKEETISNDTPRSSNEIISEKSPSTNGENDNVQESLVPEVAMPRQIEYPKMIEYTKSELDTDENLPLSEENGQLATNEEFENAPKSLIPKVRIPRQIEYPFPATPKMIEYPRPELVTNEKPTTSKPNENNVIPETKPPIRKEMVVPPRTTFPNANIPHQIQNTVTEYNDWNNQRINKAIRTGQNANGIPRITNTLTNLFSFPIQICQHFTDAIQSTITNLSQPFYYRQI